MHRARIASSLAAALALAGCNLGTPAGTDVRVPSDAGTRVLFVGNSLTYSNSMPSIVESLADSARIEPRLYARMVAFGNFNLDDHWAQGDARRALTVERWDVVVLQQGPSSLPENREQLRASSRRFADEIRRNGGRPGLYAVWPAADRQADFDRASESYALAAADVDGMLFPVGEAWRAAWRRDPSVPLYSADGLHPTPAGSYLAALVIFGQLYSRSPVGLPARIRLRSGEQLSIPPDVATLLQQAAEEANTRFGRR